MADIYLPFNLAQGMISPFPMSYALHTVISLLSTTKLFSVLMPTIFMGYKCLIPPASTSATRTPLTPPLDKMASLNCVALTAS